MADGWCCLVVTKMINHGQQDLFCIFLFLFFFGDYFGAQALFWCMSVLEAILADIYCIGVMVE